MTTNNEIRKESKGIQAIETGYRILVAIQQGPEPVALKDIASRAQVSPSQAHNYVSSFVRTGMVVSAGRGTYRLGPSLAALGMTAMTGLDRYDTVRDEALRLRDRTSLGVAVGIWTDVAPVVVFHRAGSPWGAFELRNGAVSTVGTAMGNVFLTYLDVERTDPAALQELQERGIVGEEARTYLQQLRTQVRARGYAYQILSELPGYSGIGAPIWDAEGDVRYSLSITGPADLIEHKGMDWLADELLISSTNLSRQFGAPPNYWTHTSH